MVKINKIKLETRERFVRIETFFGEKFFDDIGDNVFTFEKGKIYGIVCEYGGGGAAISCFMSNRIPWKDEKIYFDDLEINPSDIGEIGWYIGREIYSKGIIKKEISVRKALNHAVSQYHRYENINDIIEEFGLQERRLDYGLSNYSYERWRASLAIGYASYKVIYCFPWLNSHLFYNWIICSSVFRFFRKLKDEGNIIILPTSRRDNVAGFVDEIIEICNASDKIVTDDPYFREYF